MFLFHFGFNLIFSLGVPFYTILCTISLTLKEVQLKSNWVDVCVFPKNVRMYCNDINIFFSCYEKLFFLLKNMTHFFTDYKHMAIVWIFM